MKKKMYLSTGSNACSSKEADRFKLESNLGGNKGREVLLLKTSDSSMFDFRLFC